MREGEGAVQSYMRGDSGNSAGEFKRQLEPGQLQAILCRFLPKFTLGFEAGS